MPNQRQNVLVQGRSLASLLGNGPTPPGWRDTAFSHIDHCDIKADVKMLRVAEWKLNTYHGEPGELYNLHSDPGELNNLIHSPEHAGTVGWLHKRLREWEAQCAPPQERGRA